MLIFFPLLFSGGLPTAVARLQCMRAYGLLLDKSFILTLLIVLYSYQYYMYFVNRHCVVLSMCIVRHLYALFSFVLMTRNLFSSFSLIMVTHEV